MDTNKILTSLIALSAAFSFGCAAGATCEDGFNCASFSTQQDDDETGSGGGTSTSSSSSVSTSTGSGLNCAAGMQVCGEACIDVLSDEQNCGGCGIACSASAECITGACTEKKTSCFSIASDGTDDYITTVANKGYEYGTEYTIESWFYSDSSKRWGSFMGSNRIEDSIFMHGGCCGGIEGGNFYASTWLDVYSNVPRLKWSIDLGSHNNLVDIATSYDSWHHVAVQHSSEGYSMYIDGDIVASGTGEALPSAGGENFPVQLGGNQLDSARWSFGGRLGPQRVSNTIRYSARFTPTWGWKNDPSTIVLWNMSTGSGAQINDESGNFRHGTLNGPVWNPEASCPAELPM